MVLARLAASSPHRSRMARRPDEDDGEEEEEEEIVGKVYPDDAPRLLWEPDASDFVAVLDEIGTNISMIGQNDRGRAEMRVIPKAVGGHHYEVAVPKCNNHLTDIRQIHDSLFNSHFKYLGKKATI